MLESFLKYLEFEKRFSKHTVTSYSTDLRQLETFLASNEGAQNSIIAASYYDLRAWIVTLVDNEITPKSINRKIASVRAYFKFLIRRGQISEDPSRKLKAIKNPKSLPSFVKEDDLQALFDNNEFDDSFAGLRDKLVLEMLYGTGIRLSELLGLREVDISRQSNTMKVLGKRNKERIIPVNQELVQTISKYIHIRNKELGSFPSRPLILTDKGEDPYPMFVYRLVKKYLSKTTSDKNNPHVLRHTFATHLLDKGADLGAVKDLLGHSSLAATQVYTHNSIEKLKKAHQSAHPKT